MLALQVDECKNSEISMEVSHSDGVTAGQADSNSSSVLTITHEQLANLFASSGAGGSGGNVIVTSLPDGATQNGLSIATILQDVVSGMQSGSTANSNAATIQADTSGGSYYLVTQGGSIPIVIPSNGASTEVASMNLVQATSGDAQSFVVSQDTLPDGVLASAVQSDASGK